MKSNNGVCVFKGDDFFSNFKTGKKYNFTLIAGNKISVVYGADTKKGTLLSEVMSYDSFCIDFSIDKKTIINCGLYTRYYISEYKEFFCEYKFEKIYEKERLKDLNNLIDKL